jgi:predicted amidohydrolase YtcJ
VLRGRPILLARVDVHVYWASRQVIEALGELPSTVDGGEIERDANGHPTGTTLLSTLE